MLPTTAAPQRTLPLIPTTGPGERPLGSYLAHIGVQGYGDVEPIILAAIISGDPLLLVGRAGTGKTYLLNSLSEVLGLEHRRTASSAWCTSGASRACPCTTCATAGPP